MASKILSGKYKNIIRIIIDNMIVEQLNFLIIYKQIYWLFKEAVFTFDGDHM